MAGGMGRSRIALALGSRPGTVVRARLELSSFLTTGQPSLALPINLDCLRHFAQPHTLSAVSAILPAVYSTPGIRWILSLSSIFFLSFTMSMIVCKDWRVMEASG
jgi:hypothetical protein